MSVLPEAKKVKRMAVSVAEIDLIVDAAIGLDVDRSRREKIDLVPALHPWRTRCTCSFFRAMTEYPRFSRCWFDF